MNLADLPRDVLILLALEMDLPEIINLCQTSSRFNDKICRNNYFWKNKLEKDFGIKLSPDDAKDEYYSLIKMLKDDPNSLLNSGIVTENFKLVKKAVENGANLKQKIALYYPITISLKFENSNIILYLLQQYDDDLFNILKDILFAVGNQQSKTVRCRMFLNLYGLVLPYIAKVDEKKFAFIWRIFSNKMEELYNENKWCISDEFYRKWKPFYEELAQKYTSK